jgi:hypothetical protein
MSLDFRLLLPLSFDEELCRGGAPGGGGGAWAGTASAKPARSARVGGGVFFAGSGASEREEGRSQSEGWGMSGGWDWTRDRWVEKEGLVPVSSSVKVGAKVTDPDASAAAIAAFSISASKPSGFSHSEMSVTVLK